MIDGPEMNDCANALLAQKNKNTKNNTVFLTSIALLKITAFI
jgi:hypothetical protein